MPIRPIEAPETDGAFEVVHRTLSRWAAASAFNLPRLTKADPQALSIALPHRVEVAAVGDLRRNGAPARSKSADCWRFLILEDGDPIAAATAVRKEAGGFDFGGLNEGPFASGTGEAVRRAEAVIEVQKQRFEARLLMIPALYVVALWLQDEENKAQNGAFGEADLLLAIPPSNPVLVPWRPVTSSSFLEALGRAQ